MTRAEKAAVIEELKEKFSKSPYFYITDASGLTVEQTNNLRKALYERDIEMRVVKNTLVRKALEAAAAEMNYEPLYEHLKGPTAIMFTEVANAPARVIKEFRKAHEKPVLKVAYVEQAIYEGDDMLDALAALKSKEELVGDVIVLLQSPVRNVVGALQSAGQTLSGILKALEERG